MKIFDKLLALIMKKDISNVSYKIEAGPYFLFFKKHNCFNCGQMLKRRTIGKVVSPDDPLEYNALIIDTPPLGNIYLAHTIFECIDCGKQYEIEDLKYLELPELKKRKIIGSSDILEKERRVNFNTFVFVAFTLVFLIVIIFLSKLIL